MDQPKYFYKCDPMLNKECEKTSCQNECTFTTKKEYSKDGKKYIAIDCEFVECKEPTTKNDLAVDYKINGLDDFIEFGKKAFGVKLTIKKSNNSDTYEKLFGDTKNDLASDREDAIERLNAIKQFIGYDKDSEIVKATQKSLDMAIKALEKDAPKAPKKSDTPRYGMGYEYYDWCCPSCGKFLAYECDSEREKIHHCRCGQRLKWEESEE